MARKTYKVVWGDTLWEIAEKYKVTVDNLVKWNSIVNKNLIYVGQVLYVSPPDAGDPDPVDPSKPNKDTHHRPTILQFGLSADPDLGPESRTVFVTWQDAPYVYVLDGYKLFWTSYIKGSDKCKNETIQIDPFSRYAEYTASANTYKIEVWVQMIPHTYDDTFGKDWDGWREWDPTENDWAKSDIYNFEEQNPPGALDAPTVELNDYSITASYHNLQESLNATHILFEITRNDFEVYSEMEVYIRNGVASYSFSVASGYKYKVRAKSVRKQNGEVLYGKWSLYSDELSSKPPAPSGITSLRAIDATTVYIAWDPVDTALQYDIEYSDDIKDFEGSDSVQLISGIETTQYTKSNLETGKEYFFRIRSSNDSGYSAYSGIKSIILGKAPGSPSTWSSTSTAIVGEKVFLHWTNNSNDGSYQTKAEIKLIVNGTEKPLITVTTPPDMTKPEPIYTYELDITGYTEGAKIEWLIRTTGITGVSGEWSISRRMDVYVKPTMLLSLRNGDNNNLDVFNQFPLRVSADVSPKTQKPVSYNITIISLSSYIAAGSAGSNINVGVNQIIFNKNYDIDTDLNVEITASDVMFMSNCRYRIICNAYMNSGLSVSEKREFEVLFSFTDYVPNANIMINNMNLVAAIRPYCLDANGDYPKDVELSVYRIEPDGLFTEILSGIQNGTNTYIIDPHPSLGFVSYRIVAKSTITGSTGYFDTSRKPVSYRSLVIQWNEKYSDLTVIGDPGNPDVSSGYWSGTMLKMDYNIKTSDNYNNDTELVKYLGRSNPVSYYGTQIGHTASFSADIKANDYDTINMLRALANYNGDVYVRETSGMGYWASVNVGFSRSYDSLIVPVTINVTRVEGGI